MAPIIAETAKACPQLAQASFRKMECGGKRGLARFKKPLGLLREIKGAGSLTPDAGPGGVIYQDIAHLDGPPDLAPNGRLLAGHGDGSNADPHQPGEIVTLLS